MYKRLRLTLNNTRKSVFQACEELDIDFEQVDQSLLEIDQCTHCGRWSLTLVDDLDQNPICRFCVELVGL